VAEARHAFTDPIGGDECELVIPPGGAVYPGPGQAAIGVAHPGCDGVGDLAVELDAWQCRGCGRIGRVSGAWCVDMIRAARALPGRVAGVGAAGVLVHGER
jgi:hypothetical protein